MTLKILLVFLLVIIVIFEMYPLQFKNTLNNIFNYFLLEGFSSIVNKKNNQNNENNENTENTENNNLNQKTDINVLYKYNNASFGDNYFIDDGGKNNENGQLGLTSSLCSKSCCFKQYPLPFDLPIDPLVEGSDKKFVSSGYTCNNGFQDTGCVCMTEYEEDFLNNRGLNA
jgi:hypothetical protein